MARQARVKDAFGVFYISQKSGDVPLFRDNTDREAFIGILKRARSKFDFILLAYCTLAPDAYHLVIDVNGGDLSKIMKSINIAYSMHYKHEGRLFKDRYKSVLLDGEEAVREAVARLKKPFPGTSPYNSCHEADGDYCSDEGISYDDCENCIKTRDEASRKLMQVAALENMTVDQLVGDKLHRNRLIVEFRRRSTLSLKELGELFGGLSESSICKIINSNR